MAPLIHRRGWTIWIAGAAIAHLALAGAGFSPWGCALREVTGVPCPGCGLTTAALRLLRGEWADAIGSHAFAPVFLIALALLAVTAGLPERERSRVAIRVAAWERRTGATSLLLLALVIYWALRTF